MHAHICRHALAHKQVENPRRRSRQTSGGRCAAPRSSSRNTRGYTRYYSWSSCPCVSALSLIKSASDARTMGLREGWDEDGRGGRERPQGWRTGRSHSYFAAVFAIISQTRQCIVHVIVACIVMLCVAVLELPFCCTCLGCCKAVSSVLVVPYCLPRVAAPLSPAAITSAFVLRIKPPSFVMCIAFVRHGIPCRILRRMISRAAW